MILGGELSADKLTFDTGFHNAAISLKSMFCARAHFFLVPPYNERVDIAIDHNYITFTKHEGLSFAYEDAREIIQKAQRFSAIDPEKAQTLILLAQDNLPVRSTLFFPDPRRTILEFAVFINWARFCFRGKMFMEVADKVKKDLENYFPPNIKVSTNSVDEIVIRNEDGSRMLFSYDAVKKLAAVLLSYALIPPEMHSRFVLMVGQFAVMQASRIFLHTTLHELKDVESVGGFIKSTFNSDHAMRVMKELAEHGEFELLADKDSEFLGHVQLFHDKDYEAFAGVQNLKPFMQQFIQNYGPEIRALNDIRLLENGDRDAAINLGRDGTGVIDGNTMQEVTKQEELRRMGKGDSARQIKKDDDA